MSVVPGIEKAKLPACLAGEQKREEGQATSPDGDIARLEFGWLGQGAGGAAERYANRGSSREAGRWRSGGVFLGDDGRPSVCQAVIERDKRRRGRNRGLGVFIKARRPAL